MSHKPSEFHLIICVKKVKDGCNILTCKLPARSHVPVVSRRSVAIGRQTSYLVRLCSNLPMTHFTFIAKTSIFIFLY